VEKCSHVLKPRLYLYTQKEINMTQIALDQC